MALAPEPTETTSPSGKRSAPTHTEIRRIARSRVLLELGRGGMANVYLAVSRGQGGVDKLVVLKTLRTELASDPESLTMFLDEARVAAQLNHPNVVQTYEIGTYGDRPVMVMEYLEGQSLGLLLKQARAAGTPLSLAFGLRIIINVLEGLHYAHELSGYDGKPLAIVHRDISPQNVFVTYSGQVKLLDFGIAKAASSSTETAAGVIKGKIRYMAPEQVMGLAVDRRADIFSVGCMLWELATGEKLWAGLSDVAIMRELVDGKVPSPLAQNASTDPELAAIVEKALAKEPEQRFETARELGLALEALLDRMGSPVREKDLGKLVGELFAETRAQIRSIVETQLKTTALDDDVSLDVPVVPAHDPGKPTAVTQLAAPAPRRKPYVAAAGVLLLLGAGAWLFWPRATPSVVPAPREVVAAPVAEPPEPTPDPTVQHAQIEFRVSPDRATLFLDGRKLPPGTRGKIVPADGAVHELRAELEGYESSRIEFAAVANQAVTLNLPALPEKRGSTSGRVRVASPRPTPAAPAAPSAAPAAPAKPARDCTNPFFIDTSGIKRLRPECR